MGLFSYVPAIEQAQNQGDTYQGSWLGEHRKWRPSPLPSRAQAVPRATLPLPSSTPTFRLSHSPALKTHSDGQWQHLLLPTAQCQPPGLRRSAS